MTNMDASPAQHRCAGAPIVLPQLNGSSMRFPSAGSPRSPRAGWCGHRSRNAARSGSVRLEGRVERPQIGHERERIVAFVGAEREAPRARRTIIAFSGLALREPLASVRSAATTSRCGSPSARASMSIFFSFRHHFGLDRSGPFAHAATSISRQNSLIAAVLEWFQLHFRCRQPLVEIATANKRPPFVQEYFDRSPVRDPSED